MGDMKRAREYLLAFVKVYAPERVLVVFDSSRPGGQKSRGVVYTNGRTADEYIKEFVRSSPNPGGIIVVTEDREIRGYVSNLGAKVMSVRKFIQGPGRLKPPKPSTLSGKERSEINQELKKLWGLED